MNNILLVIDMQNDFVTGSLGSDQAREIVPRVVERIKQSKDNHEEIYFTKDTHTEDYLNTQEGKNLPVKHCIIGTEGHELIPEVLELSKGKMVIEKPTFGSLNLVGLLTGIHKFNPIDKITLIGLCTDVCVISNAMLLKAALPEVLIEVKEDCVAGVTKESHDAAITAMKTCQISII